MIDIVEEIQRQQEEFERQMEEQRRLQEEQFAMQQRPQQSGGMPPGSGSVIKSLMGGGGGGGGATYAGGGMGPAGTPGAAGMGAGPGSAGGAGGLGAAGMGGIIAAAIALQHGLSNATNTTFEGQKTDDAFAGNYGTEPWLAFAHDKLGLGPTAGEKFDAAVKNEDWGTALKRSPAMMNYWADPLSTWMGTGTQAVIGKKYGKWANPIGSVLDMLG